MFKISISIFLTLVCAISGHSDVKPINFQLAAQHFVEGLKNGENVKNYVEIFKFCKQEDLMSQIVTDDQKKTFFINLYNAYIQVILKEKPEKYNDRRSFFKEKQINLGGEMISFADIEHGVLRRSQNEFFMGYIRKLFPSAFEKKFRVKTMDYRIHFALNCGAKSCPPVAVYNLDRINEQLESSTIKYLTEQTKYDPETKIAYSTSLFSWFRGDFGGLKGIKSILLGVGIIPDTDVTVRISEYDWTLDLDNYIDL